MNIEFEYNLKDEVRINALNVKGLVVGFYYGETGIQYQIAYWSSGTRKTQYVYKEELGEPSDSTLGFIK